MMDSPEKPAPHRVSIRDLARLAGVSRTTVSLALRGSHEISAATRNRILDLAIKHDYRSHPGINALMQQVGRGERVQDEEVIAFIRCGSDADETAPGPLELLNGARAEAHRRGYKLEVFWAGFCASRSKELARILYHRGIRGIIWGPMPHPHPPIEFPWQQFVPISCTTAIEIPLMPVVRIDHTSAMAAMLESLSAMGAARIGYMINHAEEVRQDHRWLSGIDLYKHRAGKAAVSTLLLKAPISEKRLRAWIADRQIDVLICSHDLFQQTAYLDGQVARASLDVPQAEVGRTGGLYQDMWRIGQHALRSMSIRLANGLLGLPEHSFSVVTTANFVEGSSLAPLARKRRKPKA